MDKLLASQIKLNTKSNQLEIHFNNKQTFKYPLQTLRINPEEIIFNGFSEQLEQQQNVNLKLIEPQGDVGLSFIFDDGFKQGVFTWEILYQLGQKLVDVHT